MIDTDVIISAHRLSTHQRARYEAAHQVGCFYCEAIYSAGEIDVWCNEEEEEVTALCARCGIDSVISKNETAELGVTDNEFATLLKKMRKHWFW